MDRYLFGSLQLTRGYPFQCEFCDIIVTFGRRPRLKTAPQVAAELEALHARGVRHVFMVDDNLEEWDSAIAHLVEVDATGEAPRVVRVVIAADVGLPINPKSIEAQLQGAAIDAMSTTLSAGLHIDAGAVREGSFADYHLEGSAFRPCIQPIGGVTGRQVTTIEGLGGDGLHPVQQAWIDEDVAQCGFCQPGQIMTAVSLLRQNPHPSDADIDAAMSENVCRCGTYVRIREAIKRAAQVLRGEGGAEGSSGTPHP